MGGGSALTEPVPFYTVSEASALINLSESDVQRIIVKRLRDAGWLVIVTSQDRQTRKQLARIPDLLCFRWGEVLLIEVKRPGGKLRPGQVEFQAAMQAHLGTCVHYVVAYWPDDIERWIVTKYTSEELAIIERANREKAEVIDDMRRLTRKALDVVDAMAQELPTDVAERIRREHGLSE